MKITYVILIFVLFSVCAYGYNNDEITQHDSSEVIALNKTGYSYRLSNPTETKANARKALAIATSLNYIKGIAESNRIWGIAEYYLNNPEGAFTYYSRALTGFKQINDERGIANVNNNIGNIYQLIDYEKALEYFGIAEKIAEKHAYKELLARLQLNKGNIYNRQNLYNKALVSYEKSRVLFGQLKDSVNLIQCLENLGDIYFKLRDFSKAETMLLDANRRAKLRDMSASIAAINITLSEIYIAQSKFSDAEKYIEEGKTYAQLMDNSKNNKNVIDFMRSTYELERKRKNFEKALIALEEISKIENANSASAISTRLELQKKEQEYFLQTTEAASNAEKSRIKFWSVTLVAVLLLVVVGLLISNVRRKAINNVQLQDLNSEVSRQKDNLDRINHRLEEIIDERTKDLQEKNRRLSDYSSYLSHQIRGPIATLKGLLHLESEGLVDQEECIKMMGKCVSDIDQKIIETSDMMHTPGESST